MRTTRRESWRDYRRRMLRETEVFIEYGLNHPETIIEIPAKPVGKGGFPREVSDWFWGIVLNDDESGLIGRWKSLLRRRPKLFRGKGRWWPDRFAR